MKYYAKSVKQPLDELQVFWLYGSACFDSYDCKCEG